MAVLTGMVILGGIKRIGDVTGTLVPVMCGMYLVAGLVVLVVEAANIPRLLWLVVEEALKRRPLLKTLYTSGYTENAIVHHGRLDSGVLLLAKPYRKSELAKMLRLALGS